MAESRVLVTGGRDFTDKASIFEALDELHARTPITTIIEGGATGADERAAEWAKARGVQRETFVANWEDDGRAAGPIRNQRMIDEGKPNLVVAFPGGRGTADMKRRARAAHIPIVECSPSAASSRAGGTE